MRRPSQENYHVGVCSPLVLALLITLPSQDLLHQSTQNNWTTFYLCLSLLMSNQPHPVPKSIITYFLGMVKLTVQFRTARWPRQRPCTVRARPACKPGRPAEEQAIQKEARGKMKSPSLSSDAKPYTRAKSTEWVGNVFGLEGVGTGLAGIDGHAFNPMPFFIF